MVKLNIRYLLTTRQSVLISLSRDYRFVHLLNSLDCSSRAERNTYRPRISFTIS